MTIELTDEFHIDKENNRLSFHSLGRIVCEYDLNLRWNNVDFDHQDDLSDELSNLSPTDFKNQYPKAYHKIFKEKIVKAKNICITFRFPLLCSINILYANSNGFTINNIAKIICREYRKFYKDHNKAINNGKTPRYLPINVRNFEDLNLRFGLSSRYRALSYNDDGEDIPQFMVGVDT